MLSLLSACGGGKGGGEDDPGSEQDNLPVAESGIVSPDDLPGFWFRVVTSSSGFLYRFARQRCANGFCDLDRSSWVTDGFGWDNVSGFSGGGSWSLQGNRLEILHEGLLSSFYEEFDVVAFHANEQVLETRLAATGEQVLFLHCGSPYFPVDIARNLPCN